MSTVLSVMGDSLFAVIGDPHIIEVGCVTTKLLEVVQLLNNTSGLKYVLVTGDIAHQGTAAQLEIAKGIFDKLDSEYFCCAGNHDGIDDDAYLSVFGPEQYTSKIGRYNLMVLTRHSYWIDFEVDFEENTPTIVLKHDAIHPLRRQNMKNHFEKYNVVCVFQGHYHIQGHEDRVIDGVRYITCPSQFIGIGRLSDPIIYRFIHLENITKDLLEEEIRSFDDNDIELEIEE